MKKLAIVILSLASLSGALAASPRNGERDALRRIVQEQCLPTLQDHVSPSPCENVVLPAGHPTDGGYALLHDLKGGAHFLLIPTRTITGIESPVLLDPATPDYVAAAWHHRDILDRWLHRTLPRDAVGLAINPIAARGQDQFHIHVECVSPWLHQALSEKAQAITDAWAPVTIADRDYVARRIMGDDFLHANPLQLFDTEWLEHRHDLGQYTLIIAGRSFAAGPGFIVLVGTGRPGGETLLDSTCAVSPTPE